MGWITKVFVTIWSYSWGSLCVMLYCNGQNCLWIYCRMYLKSLCNERFGSMFRTHHNPSYFSRRMARFADIYTSKLTNLLQYSTTHTFYPRRTFLPHEPRPIIDALHYCMEDFIWLAPGSVWLVDRKQFYGRLNLIGQNKCPRWSWLANFINSYM